MKTAVRNGKRREAGSVLAYFMILMITAVSIASVGAYVAQATRLSQRRSSMVAANQYAIGGAVLACSDLNTTLTNTGPGTLGAKLASLPSPYALDSSSSTSSNSVYQRIISAPFSSQSVTARISLSTGSSPTNAMIVATATVGEVSQTATVNVKLGWGYPAAIISVNQGTTGTGVAKSVAQDGNVVMNGSKSGPLIVDGGPGLTVLANGRVNYDTNYVNPPKSSYSMTNWNTINQVPDYTTQGTSNALFDISRFIAVANKTPGGYAPSGNNHFTNLTDFMKAVKNHPNAQNAMEGVVVVDIWETDKQLGNLTDKNLPNGINIRGTMLFNFCGPGWDPVSEKIIVTADLNINPANLSGLVPTDPSTYTSGYPPVYSDPSKNPINISIAPYGFQNFTATDDLPAELYTIGCLDMHGNANICGVLYTPSYMEIENKADGQIQYIRGACIMGNGIYYENNQSSISIISFDPNTLDSLATLNGAGKQVRVAYWQ